MPWQPKSMFRSLCRRLNVLLYAADAPHRMIVHAGLHISARQHGALLLEQDLDRVRVVCRW